MMYYPLANEIQLVSLLVFMFGYIAIMLLIVGIICGVIEYIDSRIANGILKESDSHEE